ncbi:MAG: hypothetical protein ABIG89_05920 [Candidatus Woesearchaeota archaeon]
MGKRCTICGKDAQFAIKDTSDYYCEECAEENFGDVSMLVAVEEKAQKLKAMLDNKIEDENETDDADKENRAD